MFSGGDYEEVGRWLWNFVSAHAKRENLRVEALVDMAEPRAGKSYGVRLRLGDRVLPAGDEPPLEMSFADVAARRGNLAWCDDLARQVRALASRFAGAAPSARRSA